MTSTRTAVFCGGGSVGHVAPAIAVAEAMAARSGAVPFFICSGREEEKRLLKQSGFRFEALGLSGLPRGFSLAWIRFPFDFLWALLRSWRILRRERPDIVFSKSGSLSVPVCIAARCLGIPVVLHESDCVPGLGTSLLSRISKKICTGFELKALFPKLKDRIVRTGNPVRREIFLGSKSAGQRITGFSGRRPVLMVIGGSQGAAALNEAVEKHFDVLINLADIIHITGIGKELGRTHARYFSRPYVVEELPHLYALADLVITRAGAGVLSELGALKKPAIVIPLGGVAHDHQLKNALVLAENGAIEPLKQEDLPLLPGRVAALLANQQRLKLLGENLSGFFPADASGNIAKVLLDAIAG
jgi:UDP-N-acetylglucosamine--N-acetylmuramyl-(pentapeptide) pyrophosphoryl-undecaprenol N-acetylglucosamine transferase